MAERPTGKLDKKSEDARTILLNGARAFAQSRYADLDKALSDGREVRLLLEYDNQSRSGIPDNIARFANSVYGRRVGISSIGVLWIYSPNLEGRNQSQLSNTIEVKVAAPNPTPFEELHIGVCDSKREFMLKPEFRIIVGETPMMYGIRYRLVFLKSQPDQPLLRIFTGKVNPDVVATIGLTLGESNIHDTATYPLKPIGKRAIGALISKFFPESAPHITAPYRSIIISDHKPSRLYPSPF